MFLGQLVVKKPHLNGHLLLIHLTFHVHNGTSPRYRSVQMVSIEDAIIETIW
jgi:hypothetical protein